MDILEKFKAPALLALPGGFIAQVIDKYVFQDWQFVISLVIIITVDTFLGVYGSWKQGRFSSKGFSKFFEKVVIYFAVLILTHVMGTFKIDGEVNTLFSWFDHFTYSAIMIREAISILENVGRIRPDLVPTGLLKKLKSLQDGGSKQPEV